MLDCTIPSAELSTKGIYNLFIHIIRLVKQLTIRRNNSYNNSNNDNKYNKFLRNREIIPICFVS